jgi:membrane-associated phospholipid phosphatase
MLPGLLVVAVGLSRIHEGDHWPSDVAAAYLLAGILLMIIVPLYRRYVETGFG